MSDPVTNAEVEDVLSSIRRLVSEDKRPVHTAKIEPKSDRLVLTPALRVTDDEGPEKNVEEAPATDELRQIAEPDVQPSVAMTLDSLVTDDMALDVYADDVPVDELVSEELDDDVEEHLFDDPSHDYSSDPYNFDDEEDADGEGGQKPVILHLSPEFEDEQAGEPDESIETDFSQSTRFKAPENHTQRVEVSDSASDLDGERFDGASNESKAATLTAKIAALETAIGQISETFEPDDAGDSDYAGTEPEAMAWEDDAAEEARFVHVTTPFDADEPEEASVAPGPDQGEPEASQDKADPEPSAAAATADAGLDAIADEQLLDEEALRDLVSDIVRAELQGALGERITRNVRKLVRREIHRALTAQELE